MARCHDLQMQSCARCPCAWSCARFKLILTRGTRCSSCLPRAFDTAANTQTRAPHLNTCCCLPCSRPAAAEGAGLLGWCGVQPQAPLRRHRGRLQGVGRQERTSRTSAICSRSWSAEDSFTRLLGGPPEWYRTARCTADGLAIVAAQVSSKIDVIKTLLEKADKVIIVGGMVFTFDKAEGRKVRAAAPDTAS
jgi:Phosphoglycerate kinase